ncbi:MAG: choice-of-anchor D domain-containing protein [Candidatus Kapaibacterium sp.]
MTKLIQSFLFILLLMNISGYRSLSADNEYEKYVNSNLGTEFWFTVPPALIENGNSTGNYVGLYISAQKESHIQITVSGKGYSFESTILPGTTYEFSLEPHIAQPYIKTGLDPVSFSDVYKNTAICIKSDNPVSVHTAVKYNTTTEGFIVLPVNVLGKDYRVSSYPDASVYYPVYNSFPSLSGIVAVYDGTEVEFTLGGNDETVSSSGQKPGETVKKILNKGDVWMVSSKGRDADLSGSIVKASMPVAVVSGSYAANIPSVNKFFGYIAEMELPTNTWGKKYHIPHIFGRKFSAVLRVYAKDDNTDIFVDGAYHTTIAKGGGKIGEGYIELRFSELNGNKTGTISSNNPIFVTLMNTGVEEDGLPEPPGDPFQLSLSSAENFSGEMFFALPALNESGAYSSNYLSIVYKKDTQGKIPDDIMLGKYTSGVYNYISLNELQILEHFDLLNEDYGIATVKIAGTGSYSVKANDGFAAYMYGFNRETSYGFPAGLKLNTLNTADTMSPKISWDIDCLGMVNGETIDMPEDSQNRSNLAGVLFLSDRAKNIQKSKFDDLIPGVSNKINWILKILDRRLDAEAAVLFWDAAGNSSLANIYYTAANTVISPDYENFGSFNSHSEALSKLFRITNKSDTAFIIRQISLKSGAEGFALEPIELPVTIQKEQFIEFYCTFTPDTSGNFIDSIGYGDDCHFVYAAEVEAVVGNPIIEVKDVSFGDVTVGGEYSKQSLILNSGVSPLILNGFKGTNSNDFDIIFDKDFGSDNPLTLMPGDELGFTIIFNPKLLGNYTDSVKIFSNADIRDNVCIINAFGVEPGLVAESYDWGRRRIFRYDFPAGPYPIDNESSSIKIKNTGTSEIQIHGIEIESGINNEAFEFNRQMFTNLTLEPNQEFEFIVHFRPVVKGEHSLKIKYLNNFGSKSTTELRGFGTVPLVESTIVDFDTVIVENYETPGVRRIEIKNSSVDEWEYADTLSIYDFQTPDDGSISSMWAFFGEKGFKLDKEVVKFPIKLAPGKTFILVAGFVPNVYGESSSEFQVISDAIDTADILLKGFGIEQALTFTGGTGESCLGFESVISGTVKNNSKNDISIGSVLIVNPEPEFRIISVDIVGGFTLSPGSEKNMEVAYKPVSEYEKSIEIVLVDAKIPLLKKTAKFTGKPIKFNTDIVVSPAMQDADIGDTVMFKAKFRTDFDLNGFNLLDLKINIRYNNGILKPLSSELSIGSELEGIFNLEYEEERSNPGNLGLCLKSIAGLEITKDCDLFEIPFLVFYPNSVDNETDVIFDITARDNDCIEINSTSSRISVNPVCGDELRVVNFSNYKYKVGRISPNPINGANAKIEFSIGISAQTTIRIYNSIGEEIAEPINRILDKGEHEVSFDTHSLNSGLYFYRINSGPFVETGTFVIHK